MLNQPNLTPKIGVGKSFADSIFFDTKKIKMNHVNLIGKVSSEPRFYETSKGRRVVQFMLSTKEVYLDEDGKTRSRSYKHRIAAWGRWVQVLEQLASVGIELAVEGKLTTRFYQKNGENRFISEVEVNDLVIL